MQTLTTIPKIQNWVNTQKQAKKTIAFVPTMDWLHQGHLSLVELLG